MAVCEWVFQVQQCICFFVLEVCMKEFIEYLDTAMPNPKGDKMVFRFKRDLLYKMNERFAEVSGRGIENRKVFCDLIISEHRDLESEYKEYYLKQTAHSRRKRRVITNVVGSIAYILLLVVTFVGLGLATHDWGHLWLIMVDGILLWVVYLLYLGVFAVLKLKRMFHVIARILQAGAVVVLSVAVFLFCLVVFDFHAAWIIVICGIIAMFLADLLFVSINKHKLAVVYYLIYIPAIAAMLYIILAYLGVLTWSTGWLLIPAGVVADVLIIVGELLESKHFEKEMMKSWQEN